MRIFQSRLRGSRFLSLFPAGRSNEAKPDENKKIHPFEEVSRAPRKLLGPQAQRPEAGIIHKTKKKTLTRTENLRSKNTMRPRYMSTFLFFHE